tara:strand:- start:3 stop:299 length:297 start_codon:yes stop_codon:yes gene_type:complete
MEKSINRRLVLMAKLHQADWPGLSINIGLTGRARRALWWAGARTGLDAYLLLVKRQQIPDLGEGTASVVLRRLLAWAETAPEVPVPDDIEFQERVFAL